MSKISNTEDFIKKCEEKFFDKGYDYSKVRYVNNNTKVVITCPIHGDFLIRPRCVHNSKGCTLCSRTKKLSNEDILTRANLVHNNRYIYDLSNFKNVNSVITIYCKEHGKFEKRVSSHLGGRGCPLCGEYEKNLEGEKQKSSSKRLVYEDVVSRFKDIHGDKYDYRLFTEYTRTKDKIDIVCKKHGIFSCRISNHLAGCGCPRCKYEVKTTTEEIVATMRDLEPRYDYSKVVYRKYHSEVEVVCPLHGSFMTTPARFISKGCRCPKCNESKLEKEVRALLEKHNIDFVEQKKFSELVYKHHLSFDFYIPSKRLLIECQGEQHFKHIRYFHRSEKAFVEQLERDRMKQVFCQENNFSSDIYLSLL